MLHINNLINKYYLDDSSLLVVVIKTFELLKKNGRKSECKVFNFFLRITFDIYLAIVILLKIKIK